MTINSNLPPQIHKARVEALKKENVKDENLHGMDKEFENRLDRTLCIRRRSWLLRVRDLGELVQHESRKPNYFIYPRIGRKHLEFQIGGKVMLKASHWEGAICFSKRGKLNPRYIGPFKILAKVGTLAYRLELPDQLIRVHNTFYVSNLKKCFIDEPLAIPLDEIQIDDKLNFIEEPVEIMDREVKRLKKSRIPIVKVRWNSRRGLEFTWECEDQMKKKYPYLFVNPYSTS
ncbi:hypothetical protein Tco_0871680 [Tanacetum coccineum]